MDDNLIWAKIKYCNLLEAHNLKISKVMVVRGHDQKCNTSDFNSEPLHLCLVSSLELLSVGS